MALSPPQPPLPALWVPPPLSRQGHRGRHRAALPLSRLPPLSLSLSPAGTRSGSWVLSPAGALWLRVPPPGGACRNGAAEGAGGGPVSPRPLSPVVPRVVPPRPSRQGRGPSRRGRVHRDGGVSRDKGGGTPLRVGGPRSGGGGEGVGQGAGLGGGGADSALPAAKVRRAPTSGKLSPRAAGTGTPGPGTPGNPGPPSPPCPAAADTAAMYSPYCLTQVRPGAGGLVTGGVRYRRVRKGGSDPGFAARRERLRQMGVRPFPGCRYRAGGDSASSAGAGAPGERRGRSRCAAAGGGGGGIAGPVRGCCRLRPVPAALLPGAAPAGPPVRGGPVVPCPVAARCRGTRSGVGLLPGIPRPGVTAKPLPAAGGDVAGVTDGEVGGVCPTGGVAHGPPRDRAVGAHGVFCACGHRRDRLNPGPGGVWPRDA